MDQLDYLQKLYRWGHFWAPGSEANRVLVYW